MLIVYLKTIKRKISMKMNKVFLAILLLSTTILNAQEKKLPDSKINKHNFAMNIGYSYRLSSKPNELFVNQTQFEDHYKSLRHGLTLNFAYDYMIKPNLGLGFVASAFNSAQTTYSIKDSVDLKDDEYMFYAGPSVKYLLPSFNEKYDWYVSATIGYLSFRNSSQVAKENQYGVVAPVSMSYKGTALGYGLYLGLNYRINSYLSLGCNAGFFGGQIAKLKEGENEYELNQKENLNRLDFTIGVRIKL